MYPVLVDKYTNHPELSTIKITTSNKPLYITVVYRRPEQTTEEDILMYDALTQIVQNNDAVIVGDFNLPRINWQYHTGLQSESHRLLNFIDDNFLFQHVNQPTRENNILDLVISTQENLVTNTLVGEQLSTCDHNLIRFSITTEIKDKRNNNIQIPNYRQANYKQLRTSLSTISLDTNESTENMWNSFISQFKEKQNMYIPMKRRNQTVNDKPPWFNTDISETLRLRNKYYKLKKNNPNNFLITQYVTARREVKKLIRSAKKQHEINIARECKNNPKLFYGYINNRKEHKSGIGPLLKKDDSLTTNNEEVADTLNNYFSSVFTTSQHSNNDIAIIHSQHTIEELIINRNDVLNYLDKMKENKSPGPDRIYPKILKNIKNEISTPLTQIFNKSLKEKTVPNDWKLANVTPIFKKGDRKLPGNYRPISLTSVVCKLLESIIRDKIVKHLELHNLIRDSQHGFRNKRSCLTNLLEFYNKLFHMHDQSKTLDIIYLDFKKAFDKVPHNKLLTKIKALGITGNIYGWIEDWLRDRKQRVVVNGEKSSWTPVSSGVPQGSVLGPILFLIYINDIDIGINSPISKFADDTKIGRPVTDNKDRQNLQNDLDTISKWSEKWQMPFNTSKCQLLQIGSANKKYTYKMKGNNIESVTQTRDLGVIISNNLKFSQQCNEVALRANRMLGFIKRNFVFKSKDIIIPLYQSLVRPHLEYAVQFWSPHLQKDILKLEAVQRRATKLIPSLRQKSYNDRLRELNLFSLKKRRTRGQLIECFKILKGFNNVDASNLLSLAPHLPTRGNSLKLKGQRVNLDSTKYFFTNDIVDKWNSLPENVIQSKTIDSFKKNLDIYLSQNQLE